MIRTIVIAGGGHAAARTAQAVRALGFDGRLHMVSEELHRPYQRPPLSKEVLDGSAREDALAIPGLPAWDELEIDWLGGSSLVSVDAGSRRAILADGTSIAYDALVMATGARPRQLGLPGLPEDAVMLLRTIEDAAALRRKFAPGKRLCVIGGGVIGLEVAAAARACGLEVTVLEGGAEVMRRILPAPAGRLVRWMHEAAGVEVRLSAPPVSGEMLGETAILRLADATVVEADIVVAGIGVAPNVEALRDTGLDLDGGIRTDAGGRTSNGAIFATGDVALSWRPLLDRHVRLETWRNADEQPAQVAKSILGELGAYDAVPWMWSDQYGTSIQSAGEPLRADLSVERGGSANRSFFYLRHGRLVGGVTVGRSRDMRPIQRLIASRAQVDPRLLADEGTSLVDLMRASEREHGDLCKPVSR